MSWVKTTRDLSGLLDGVFLLRFCHNSQVVLIFFTFIKPENLNRLCVYGVTDRVLSVTLLQTSYLLSDLSDNFLT